MNKTLSKCCSCSFRFRTFADKVFVHEIPLRASILAGKILVEDLGGLAAGAAECPRGDAGGAVYVAIGTGSLSIRVSSNWAAINTGSRGHRKDQPINTRSASRRLCYTGFA